MILVPHFFVELEVFAFAASRNFSAVCALNGPDRLSEIVRYFTNDLERSASFRATQWDFSGFIEA
jgi:hypothetical protein